MIDFPVNAITTPPATTATEESRSPSTWRNAPRRFQIVLVAVPESQCNHRIGDEADDGDDDHPRRLDGLRIPDAHIALVKKPDRDHKQRESVDERGEDFASMPAVRPRVADRESGKPDCDKAEDERKHVHEHVTGIAQQGKTAREESANQFGKKDNERQHDRKEQTDGHIAIGGGHRGVVALVAVLVVMMSVFVAGHQEVSSETRYSSIWPGRASTAP